MVIIAVFSLYVVPFTSIPSLSRAPLRGVSQSAVNLFNAIMTMLTTQSTLPNQNICAIIQAGINANIGSNFPSATICQPSHNVEKKILPAVLLRLFEAFFITNEATCTLTSPTNGISNRKEITPQFPRTPISSPSVSSKRVLPRGKKILLRLASVPFGTRRYLFFHS